MSGEGAAAEVIVFEAAGRRGRGYYLQHGARAPARAPVCEHVSACVRMRRRLPRTAAAPQGDSSKSQAKVLY